MTSAIGAAVNASLFSLFGFSTSKWGGPHGSTSSDTITYRKSFGENICRSQRHGSGFSGADLVKTIVHLELRSLLPEGLGGRPNNDWWRRKKRP